MALFQLVKSGRSEDCQPQRWQREGKRDCASTATKNSREAIVVSAFSTLEVIDDAEEKDPP
jgi:hypothetical protein